MPESSPTQPVSHAPKRDSDSPVPGQKRKRISGTACYYLFKVGPIANLGFLIVACDECRARKSRCDGIRPTCQSCVFHNVPCIYEQPKAKANVTKE